jgi:5-bromo-4-chloroindolyl phosphate hydrolysis protein
MVATRRAAAAQLASSRATRALVGYVGLVVLILGAILLSAVVSAGIGIPIFTVCCGGYIYVLRGGHLSRRKEHRR